MMNIRKGTGLILNYREHELVNCGNWRCHLTSRYDKVPPSICGVSSNKYEKESTGFGELDMNTSKTAVP